MARADAIKISRGEACKRSSAMAAGTKRRSRFSHRCPVLSGNLLHNERTAELFFAESDGACDDADLDGADFDGADFDTWEL
jgi:hypothetical protein